LHPHEAQHLESQKKELEKLLADDIDLISGIGETGFDFYYEHSIKDDQSKSFIWQIGLAKQWNRTMVIHTRDAWVETFQLLEAQGWPEKTVLHCFTGGPDEALRSVENGAYISISGISTFKNAQDIRDAIEVVPLDRLLCETDAPWLAPVPHRGKLNEPSFVSFVIDAIVQVRQEKCGNDEEEVRTALFENATRLFRQ
jgi:TatD DNase family protein